MPHPPEISLLIADDHQLVRDLVASHLCAQGGFVVTAAETLGAALDAIRVAQGFDAVLLDFAMPGVTGVASVAELIAANPAGRVALFSGLVRPETVAEAMACGAAGFIPKSTPATELASAIRRMVAGELYLPEGFRAVPDRERGDFGLSPRERQVLRDLSAGLMNKEIASRLGLSEVTVKMHVRSICAKLKARNRTHAAILAAGMRLE